MERIEEKARKRRRRERIQRTVLSVISTAGTLAVAIVAPNVFQALPHIMGEQRYKLAFQTKSALGRLIVKGYVTRDARGMLRATEAGVRHLQIEMAREKQPARSARRWDGRYRLVLFDIPQRRRAIRDRLRRLMGEFGFFRLQDSVWVSPYDCEELVALVKAELHLGHDVLYAVVEEIGNARKIKSHFGLAS